jgi:hypothetical protein
VLVCQELTKEHIGLDAVADQEHATELLKGKVGPTGRPASAKGTPGVPLPSKGGTDRRAARLATRRPDLADAVALYYLFTGIDPSGMPQGGTPLRNKPVSVVLDFSAAVRFEPTPHGVPALWTQSRHSRETMRMMLVGSAGRSDDVPAPK